MKSVALALALAANAYAQSLGEAIAGNPDLSALGTLIQGIPGLGNLTNVTLLAPNNDAIMNFTGTDAGAALATDQNLVLAVLNYHTLTGQHANITNATFFPTALNDPAYSNVTGGQVVQAAPSDGNVTFISGLFTSSSVVNTTNFTGGVIHIIDRLLTVPQNTSTTAVALNLTSAVGAITNLSLVETVDSTPDVTIFIPNNAAFQRIGGNLANLSTEELTNILSYHVVAGSVLYSTDLENGTSVATAQGNNITITLEGEDVFVNNARVIRPNALVANGVVHVIDRVLNPDNTTAVPNASTTEEAFPGATSASDEPFTSGVPTPTSAIDTSAVESATATSSGGAFRPLETGAIGMAALFGGAAAVMNL